MARTTASEGSARSSRPGLRRRGVPLRSRRTPGRDGLALPSDVVVLECATSEGPRELAMDRSPVTGFLSWVESAPPVR